MRILITGATGLVGSRLIEQCLAMDHQVHFLTTRADQLHRKDTAKGFLWNPLKGEIDLNCFKEVDTIVNLAGSSISKPWTKRNKRRILQSRIDSLKTLRKGIQSINDHSIKNFVTASAIGIYKEDYNTKITEETTDEADDFLGSVVQAWEKEADAFNAIGLQPIIVRIGLVLSSKGGVLPSLLAPVKFNLGVIFGNGDQWQSWLHIDDLVQIILYLSSNGFSGVYNAVAPNPVRQKELVRSIAKVMDKKIISFIMPTALVKLIFGDRSSLLLNSHCISASKLKKTEYKFSYSTLNQALEYIID